MFALSYDYYLPFKTRLKFLFLKDVMACLVCSAIKYPAESKVGKEVFVLVHS